LPCKDGSVTDAAHIAQEKKAAVYLIRGLGSSSGTGRIYTVKSKLYENTLQGGFRITNQGGSDAKEFYKRGLPEIC
jgi:hypothetical protein